MDVHGAVEKTFRADYSRLLASLIDFCGDFDLAEEGLQEAIETALSRWPGRGVPDNTAGWLYVTARRKILDRLRKARTSERHSKRLAVLEAALKEDDVAASLRDGIDAAIPDERLRLIFTCCHPALHRQAQVALTLRTLCGLTTPQIASAFLLSESTVAQRIVRAKRKIRDALIPYRIPPASIIGERLEPVMAVIYLVFNEGYAPTDGALPVRVDLAQEAIHLARLLVDLLPVRSEPLELLALLLLQDSRRPARTDAAGRVVLLDDQDRGLWDGERIREGLAALRRSTAVGRSDRQSGAYGLQAAIAAEHCRASRPEDTDWVRIEALYERLAGAVPTPVVFLNWAVASRMARGPAAGLAAMDGLEIAEPLADYRWYHVARAEMLRDVGHTRDAAAAYRTAIDLCDNAADRNHLEGRLANLHVSDHAADRTAG